MTPFFNHNKATLFLCTFFVLVFAVSFALNPYFPAHVIAGESSVGTWMSGVLLVTAATASLVIGMRRKWYPWFVVTAFFLLLAMDERFMFHERLKERIIFSVGDSVPRIITELPVMLGACVGIFIVAALWRNVKDIGKIWLIGAMVCGGISVVVDVMAAGVFIEDCFKLVGELLVACLLLSELTHDA